MNQTVRIQLSVMMFLEFFVWGAWYVTMGTYLGQNLEFSGGLIGNAYSSTAWAAIVSPFFVGMVADRYFSAEKVMAALHLIGGVLLFIVSYVTQPALFFVILLAYTLCYMPTLALVNAISFNQMTDTEREFPGIRVLGTIGWIVAGGLLMGTDYVIDLMDAMSADWTIEATSIPMKIAAAASIVLGLYSFTLPKTPPKSLGHKVTVKDVTGLDTLRLLRERSFAVFVICSLLITIPLSFYYNFTNLFLNESGMTGTVGKMTLGQMSEILFLLVMPFFFKRLGVKYMLLVGMLAWTARYLLFAFGDTGITVWMLYGGILLHGVCFDFFFVTGQIYTDQKAPKAMQANAQGFIALVTYGVGMAIGAYVSGFVVQFYEIPSEGGGIAGHFWQSIWLIPAIMAGIVCFFFDLLFDEKPRPKMSPSEAVEKEAQTKTV